MGVVGRLHWPPQGRSTAFPALLALAARTAIIGRALGSLALLVRAIKTSPGITTAAMAKKDRGMENESSPVEPRLLGPPWLTVESALYIGLVLIAGLLRFCALGAQPLQEKEAELALNVWRFSTGGAASIRGFSPLLFHGTTLSYALFGASDYATRMIPALAGTAMVGLPYLLRPYLGRSAALICSTILAFSPSFVFFSRQLDGGIVAAAAALALLAGVLGYLSQRKESQLFLVAGALGILLTADGSAYATLLALGAFFVATMIYSRRRSLPGSWSTLAWVQADKRPEMPWRAFLVFAGLIVLISTGLLVNLQGVQATLDLFPSWLGQFRPVLGGHAWPFYGSLLVSYELPVLLFGLAGACYLTRRDLFFTLLTCWFGLSMVLYSLMGTKPPSGVLQILLPLTLLAAKSIADLLDRVREGERWLWSRLSLLVCIPALLHLVLQLAAFGDPANPGDPTYLKRVFLSLFFLVCVALFVGALSMDWRSSFYSGGLVVLVIFAALMARTTWRLNYDLPGNPFELLVESPTSPDVRNLAKAIEEFSDQQEGQRDSIDVTIVGDENPLLAWYLKGFPDLTFVSQSSSPATSVIVTPLTVSPYLPDYRGARFRIQSSWTGEDQTVHALINWFLFRESIQPPVHREVMMWVAPEAEE
jgi:uncharacterized protein (TIGR03663 family)